jgi:hypothetical protein
VSAFTKTVTPVKTGVQTFCKYSKHLDSGFRRNDERKSEWTSCHCIKVRLWTYVIGAQQNLAECSRKEK